jgi:HTH-type transcriptional regulator, competence development regulator
MDILRKRLKDLREKFDYSQKQVAEAIGISNVQLSRYESGIETLSQLRLLLIFMV